jgi:vitamin B12 transporter
MRKIYLFCLACAISTHVAHSQDSLSATTLHEVVISAARAEQPVIETPRSVTVIHGSTIRESVYQSVGELLNMQSGIFISGANQTPGTNQNIFMRGANSNQVAVLIDGVRVTDPTSPNAAIDLSEISIANVERIEVIRGSHSTIFGGAAVGGVINIITKGGSTPGLNGDVSILWKPGGVKYRKREHRIWTDQWPLRNGVCLSSGCGGSEFLGNGCGHTLVQC